ncbi:MAG TPA: hypothetical protein VNT79_11300 [Phycisphaerae bacterium]|nr:hypothetical protein [Phycisphaerae bacterium]
MFNYDWWFHGPYAERINEAKRRCCKVRFPELTADKIDKEARYKKFFGELEARTIIYLRDGFSYEIREIVGHPATTTLTFECMPADEAYKVGAFVVTLPFEDIVRVEIFAVHPTEKPEDTPSIKGFAGSAIPPMPAKRMEERGGREAGE